MNKKQKTIVTIGFVGLLILILLLRGRKAQTIEEITQAAAVPVIGGTIEVSPYNGITIPSLNFPPRDGPINWPSFDWGGETTSSGISTCGCDGVNQAPMRAPVSQVSVPEAMPTITPVIQTVYQAVKKVGSSMVAAVSSPGTSGNGYVTASGSTTSGVWW